MAGEAGHMTATVAVAAAARSLMEIERKYDAAPDLPMPTSPSCWASSQRRPRST